MANLYVDKKIKIEAPAEKVWEALVSRARTDVWALEFGGEGGPLLHIESDWQLGSPVLWKDEDGTLVVEGTVTALKPYTMMRYTVFDVHSERPEVGPEDGITYELLEHDGGTILHVRQGDFGALKGGAKLRDASMQTWDRVLSRIKMLAEVEVGEPAA